MQRKVIKPYWLSLCSVVGISVHEQSQKLTWRVLPMGCFLGALLVPGLLPAQEDLTVELQNILKTEARVMQRLEQLLRIKKLQALGAAAQTQRQKGLEQSNLPRFSSENGLKFEMQVEQDSNKAELILDGWFCDGILASTIKQRLGRVIGLTKAVNGLAGFLPKDVDMAFRTVQADFAAKELYEGLSLTVAGVRAAAQSLRETSAEKFRLVTFEIRPTEGGVHILTNCWSMQDLQEAERLQQAAFSQLILATEAYEQRLRVNQAQQKSSGGA